MGIGPAEKRTVLVYEKIHEELIEFAKEANMEIWLLASRAIHWYIKNQREARGEGKKERTE